MVMSFWLTFLAHPVVSVVFHLRLFLSLLYDTNSCFGQHFEHNRLITDHADVLRELRDKVSWAIDAQSVARNMFQSNALTLKELQSVQSKHSEPVKATEQLLNIVMDQSENVYSCFLDALKQTDHQKVYECIVSGSYKGTYDKIIIRGICRIFVFL